MRVEGGLTDEQVLFLTDIFPTGYQAAENGNIQGGETVAIWGCGPVGQFAIRSAYLLGAGRVIAIDRFPERLEMARASGGAEVINYEETDNVVQALKDMTDGVPRSALTRSGWKRTARDSWAFTTRRNKRLIQQGKIDPSFVITHHLPLDEAPYGYEIFRKKEDGSIKVVMKP